MLLPAELASLGSMFFLSWHTLIIKILRHTKKYVFVDPTEKIGIILIHSHQTVMLAVVIFLYDNLREKRSIPLTK